ncbi:glycoside hydrolase family 16 protein [Streptomyces sp. NPDC079167]|uniref:glycoside hydrolase family 16 protein n=1 Tax=Streptomyces sp. NPDC079167 TaxID=3154513 RepID=UPI003438F026
MAPERESNHIGRRALLAGGGALALSAFLEAPASAAEVPPNPLQKSGWTLDRHDEFNGSLDSSLWVTKYLESRTTAERAAARYGFRNNALILRIEDSQPTYYAGNPMKVSSIQTGQMTGLHKTTPLDHSIPTKWNYTPKYGYFEIRAKTSARSGLHAAFWAVGTQNSAGQNAEIDILEDPGPNPNQFLFNLHKWSDPNLAESSNTITTGFNLNNEMHIYALEWNQSQIKLYIDNKLVKTINSSPAYNMAFLLSIYENAGWTGTVDPTDTRPKEFVVDYFRAYKPA